MLKKLYDEIISLKDPINSMKHLLIIFFLFTFLDSFGDSFFLWIICNLLLILFPLNKKMKIKESIISLIQKAKGLFGVVEKLIPRYVEKEEIESESK